MLFLLLFAAWLLTLEAVRFGGRGSRSREDVDLPDGTQQVADVVGQPVHQHCERHGDAGEDVHDREHPQHHLLHHYN